MRYRGLLILLVALLFVPAVVADDVEESRRAQRAALEAFKANDFPAFLTQIRRASDLRPQHPTLLYQLAGALDRNGRGDEAVRVLERLAGMGFVYDAAKDFTDARYRKVIARFEENRKPRGEARVEAVIPRTALIPEGMTRDGERLFVSSVRTRTIFVIGPGGEAKPFATAPYGVFGMVADPKRGVLWATTSALPQVEGYDAAQKGKSAVLRIGLWTGRVLETIAAPDDAAHHFGDVALAPDGEVYVSDGATPTIYRVAREGEAHRLVPFVTGPFPNLQGLTVLGNVLHVADYSKGLFAIDRRTGDVHALRVPPDVSLLGVDGLYAVDAKTLVATQNGTNPNRIIRIGLTSAGMAVSAVKTLLANHERLGDPTLGVVSGGRFFFNANAQWDQFGEDGRIADPLKMSEAVVLSVAIDESKAPSRGNRIRP